MSNAIPAKNVIRLSASASDDVAGLIGSLADVRAALDSIGKEGWSVSLGVLDVDGNDSNDADLTDEIARAALNAQRDHIIAELGKHGIEID